MNQGGISTHPVQFCLDDEGFSTGLANYVESSLAEHVIVRVLRASPGSNYLYMFSEDVSDPNIPPEALGIIIKGKPWRHSHPNELFYHQGQYSIIVHEYPQHEDDESKMIDATPIWTQNQLHKRNIDTIRKTPPHHTLMPVLMWIQERERGRVPERI